MLRTKQVGNIWVISGFHSEISIIKFIDEINEAVSGDVVWEASKIIAIATKYAYKKSFSKRYYGVMLLRGEYGLIARIIT